MQRFILREDVQPITDRTRGRSGTRSWAVREPKDELALTPAPLVPDTPRTNPGQSKRPWSAATSLPRRRASPQGVQPRSAWPRTKLPRAPVASRWRTGATSAYTTNDEHEARDIQQHRRRTPFRGLLRMNRAAAAIDASMLRRSSTTILTLAKSKTAFTADTAERTGHTARGGRRRPSVQRSCLVSPCRTRRRTARHAPTRTARRTRRRRRRQASPF